MQLIIFIFILYNKLTKEIQQPLTGKQSTHCNVNHNNMNIEHFLFIFVSKNFIMLLHAGYFLQLEQKFILISYYELYFEISSNTNALFLYSF